MTQTLVPVEAEELKLRYGRLLRKYIQILDHWTAVSGGSLVTPEGQVLANFAPNRARALKVMESNLAPKGQVFANFASSRARALKEVEQDLSAYEPDEAAYVALKNEFLFALVGARNTTGNNDWVKNAVAEVEKEF